MTAAVAFSSASANCHNSPATSAELALDAGEHVVEIQAIDRLGNVEERPVRVTVRVAAAPRWWLWPALGAVLVALAVIGRRARRSS